MSPDPERTNPAQEEDAVPVRGVLAVGAAAVLTILASLAVAALWTLGGGVARMRLPAPAGAAVAQVLQTPIDPAVRSPGRPAAGPEQPGQQEEGYAWADRARGEIRMPIEDAMEAVVRRYGR